MTFDLRTLPLDISVPGALESVKQRIRFVEIVFEPLSNGYRSGTLFEFLIDIYKFTQGK